MVASIYFDQVQQRYIADSGRPADTVALAYRATNIDPANGNVVGVPVLTAREVYQVLKDLALGVRHLRSVRIHADGGSLTADIDGWALTLGLDGNSLDHCQSCVADDGRLATQQAWPRYGTDPVSLLSVWERAQLERVLPGQAMGASELLADSAAGPLISL